MSNTTTIKQSAIEALEHVRLEAVKRLKARNLPTVVMVPRRHVVDDPNGGGGYTVEWRRRKESGLLNPDSQPLFMEEGQLGRATGGFRQQLEPLAQQLDSRFNLGNRPLPVSSPTANGSEKVLSYILSPWAHHYLESLTDINLADGKAAARLVDELLEYAQAKAGSYTHQLILDTLVVKRPYSHENVSIRPLSSAERGQIAASDGDPFGVVRLPRSDAMFGRAFTFFMPCTLLSTKESEPFGTGGGGLLPTLLNKVVLSLLLESYSFSTNGLATVRQNPHWLQMSIQGTEFVVKDRRIPSEQVRTLTEANFKAAVDLALHIPDFGFSEKERLDIVLSRALRGLGARIPQAGFLDLVTALEAAILGGSSGNISFRFKLYGALFLANDMPTKEAFDKLENIYRIRSKLAHGSPVKDKDYRRAVQDIVPMTRTLLRRAILHGWPEEKQLNELALSSSIPGVTT